MPFPPKRYFTLKELTERWGVPMSEIADYARNGELEVSIMTVALSAELGRLEADTNGEMLEVREQDTVLFGPQPVLSSDLWLVFGRSVHRITYFKPRTPECYLKIADGCPCVRVTIPELLVTRVERDRFEVANGLVFDDARQQHERSRTSFNAAAMPRSFCTANVFCLGRSRRRLSASCTRRPRPRIRGAPANSSSPTPTPGRRASSISSRPSRRGGT